MQFIFNRSPQYTRSHAMSPQWNNVRAGLAMNLAQVMSYYHKRSMAVKSNHLLVRLLNTARLNYEAPVQRFYEAIDVQAENLSRSFGLTSANNQGTAHDGVFYGAGTKEVIVGSSQSFDVREVSSKWMYQSPVRVIYTEKTDIDMHLPNGSAYSSEKGVAIIDINIPMLFVMYQGFVREQLENLRKGIQPKVAAQFVHGYVLPNMIPSHLDFALFNRTLMVATGATPATSTSRKHAQALANWAPQVERVIKTTVDLIAKTDPSLEDMLTMIPSVTAINGSQAMRLPSMTPTHQYVWVEVAARARVLAGCIVMSPSRLLANNKSDLQAFNRAVEYGRLLNPLERVLGPDAKDIVETVDIVKLTA